jgi:hypothetical protein
MATTIAKRYQAASPEAKVSGANVAALLDTIRDEDMRVMVEEHGFGDIDHEAWYSQQKFLDVIKEVEQHLTFQELVAIGMRGAETVHLPPEIQSFEDVKDAIVAAYGLNHQHVPEDEGYRIIEEGSTVMVECNIPYPPFVLFGYIYGLLRRFEQLSEKVVTTDEESEPYRIVIRERE